MRARYLTNGQPSVERFPISFKTHFSGNYFHHVVLGIYCNGRYGSLGMSRRSDLMDKPLIYRTLSDLIFEFEDSYKKYLHSVKKVKIGLYVPHEPHSFQPIEWKQLVLNVSKMMRTEVRKELEKFARDMRMKVGPHTRAVHSEAGVPRPILQRLVLLCVSRVTPAWDEGGIRWTGLTFTFVSVVLPQGLVCFQALTAFS